MKDKDVLYFEEDDKSELGVNGKQVFVTKRINGKTEHNKKSKEKKKEEEKEELKDNEIIIDLPYISRTSNKNSKKQTPNETSNTPKNKENTKSKKKKPEANHKKKLSKNTKKMEDKKAKKKKEEEHRKNLKKQQKGREEQIEEDKIRKKSEKNYKKIVRKQQKERKRKDKIKKKNKVNKRKNEETTMQNDVMTIEINNIKEIEGVDNQKLNKTETKKTKKKNGQRKQYNKNKEKDGEKKKYNKKSEEKQYKKKKRKKKSKTIKIFISLVLLVIALIIFALVSPIFNIQEITVYGNETVSTETIISLSGLQTEKNIFQNISSDIISKIKENTYIDEVTIKRILPGTIEITVEEREVAYQVNVINSYVYLDYQGYILETSSEKADVPILSGLATSEDTLLNGQRLESDDISKLNAILKIVDNAKQLEIYDLITEIIIEENEYILYLKSEKKYIYLGDSSNITNKMMYAEIIIEKEKGNEGYAMINGDLDDGFDPYFREESID